jgi:hypothetical protein
LFGFVSHVEIQLPVRTEGEGVDAMVVVDATDTGEKQFAFIGLAIAVCISQDEYVGRVGNNDFVSEHANAERGIDAGVLVENSFFIGVAGSFCVLQDDYAIALRLEHSPLLKR